jgi:hypothetical protein
MFRFAEKLNVQPVLKAQAFTSDNTVLSSAYTRLAQAHWITYVIPLGDFGTTVSTDNITFTVECSTAAASNATEVNVPFKYRISGKPDANSMGTITQAVSTDGVSVSGALSAQDGAIVLLDVDPSEAYAAHAQSDSVFVRLVATFSGVAGSGVLSAHAVIEPRYPGNAIPSAT